jgi:hypothetical protein
MVAGFHPYIGGLGLALDDPIEQSKGRGTGPGSDIQNPQWDGLVTGQGVFRKLIQQGLHLGQIDRQIVREIGGEKSWLVEIPPPAQWAIFREALG